MTYAPTDANVAQTARLIVDLMSGKSCSVFEFDRANARDILTAHHAELERQGWQMVLEEDLDRISALFSEIRSDWTDPRHECREGWAILAKYRPKPPGGDK